MHDVPYLFIIDTDSYSGNFERELCAYVTGHWDQDTHGRSQAEKFTEEEGEPNPFEDYIECCSDEYGRLTPQCLEATPKELHVANHYSSVGVFFNKKPTPELISILKRRSYKFAEQGLIFDRPVELKILGFRLCKYTVIIDEEEI